MAHKEPLYRNIEKVISCEGAAIDPFCLWKLNEENILILVDEDEFITHQLELEKFKKIEE